MNQLQPFHNHLVQRWSDGDAKLLRQNAEDLGCPPALPSDEATRAHWLVAGRAPAREAMNCSGKHAAMLATCVANGWDTTTYLDPQHPLQQAITATFARLTGVAVTTAE